MKPKFSIITATYNSEKFIEETYASILKQTVSDWEWIVTDDFSSDKTRDILQNLAKDDYRIKLIFNKNNLGAGLSRNQSIINSNGQFLAFLDSDDLWRPCKLEKQRSFMLQNNAGICITCETVISEDGSPTGRTIDLYAPKTINYFDLLSKRAVFGCSSVMVDRSIIDSEIIMPELRTGQDYVTWLGLLKIGHNAVLLREPLTSYRLVSNSISKNKIKKAIRQWEIYRSVERVALPSAMYYFANYVIRAITERFR
jgi:teichuronic acid biosynthesis glycosyltransferase TuaG